MWIGPGPPLDEPKCGYYGEYCLKEDDLTATIVGGVLGGLLFIVLIGAALFYRSVTIQRRDAITMRVVNNITNLIILLHEKKFWEDYRLTMISNDEYVH